MKSILLIGLGHFGKHIAVKLHELRHQIMAVDISEDRIHTVLPYVTKAQIGDSTDERFLRSLGIRNYDVCIVTIGDNFQNALETVSLLKDLGARKVIARASRSVEEKFLLRNGADEVIYPEKQLASWIAVRCTSEHILDYIELDEDYSIYELEIPPAWHGKTIMQLNIRQKYGINVLGIRHNGKLDMNILPETVLQKENSVYVLGTQKAIMKCFHIFR